MASLQQARAVPGDVVTYAFIWSSNATLGHGIVARPCLVLHAARLSETTQEAVLLPITHTVQGDPRFAVQVPREMLPLMGLDDRPNYIVTNEANMLVWGAETPHVIGRVSQSLLRTVSFAVAAAQSRRAMHLTLVSRSSRRKSRGRSR